MVLIDYYALEGHLRRALWSVDGGKSDTMCVCVRVCVSASVGVRAPVTWTEYLNTKGNKSSDPEERLTCTTILEARSMEGLDLSPQTPKHTTVGKRSPL